MAVDVRIRCHFFLSMYLFSRIILCPMGNFMLSLILNT